MSDSGTITGPAAAHAIIMMGVSGCGKSTLGAALSGVGGWPFLDADDYHPKANVDKMAAGIGLNDDDRWPWLDIFGKAMAEAAAGRGRAVGACSALKKIYRQRLADAIGEPVLFVLLDGSRETLFRRMSARADHYMPPGLLDSQLALLERPGDDEPVIIQSLEQDSDEIVRQLKETISTITSTH